MTPQVAPGCVPHLLAPKTVAWQPVSRYLPSYCTSALVHAILLVLSPCSFTVVCIFKSAIYC